VTIAPGRFRAERFRPWVDKSKSINARCAIVMAAMCLPSGDQRGEKNPLEPGKGETRLVIKSMV
jgi:hypothetical protein